MKYTPMHRSFRLLLGLAVLLLTTPVFGQAIAKKSETVTLKAGLKTMLQEEGATKLKKLDVNVDATKAKALKQAHGIDVTGRYTVYRGLNAEDASVGTVVIVNEEGKEGPLQLLVAFRPAGSIYDLGFTLFGEDKGKSALSWGYLRQYIDKSITDDLMLGKDVDGVSGATWTSTSIAQAVKKAVVVYHTYVQQDG